MVSVIPGCRLFSRLPAMNSYARKPLYSNLMQLEDTFIFHQVLTSKSTAIPDYGSGLHHSRAILVGLNMPYDRRRFSPLDWKLRLGTILPGILIFVHSSHSIQLPLKIGAGSSSFVKFPLASQFTRALAP